MRLTNGDYSSSGRASAKFRSTCTLRRLAQTVPFLRLHLGGVSFTAALIVQDNPSPSNSDPLSLGYKLLSKIYGGENCDNWIGGVVWWFGYRRRLQCTQSSQSQPLLENGWRQKCPRDFCPTTSHRENAWCVTYSFNAWPVKGAYSGGE